MKYMPRVMVLRVVAASLKLALVAACGASVDTQSPATSATPLPDSDWGAEPAADVTKEVVFGTRIGPYELEWKLDVYAPPTPGPWPVVVFAHAFGGKKDGYVELSQRFALEGAVVFAFDWPTPAEDVAMQEDGRGVREMIETVACAVRFARAKAAESGGDPELMTLGGHAYGAAVGAWCRSSSGTEIPPWSRVRCGL